MTRLNDSGILTTRAKRPIVWDVTLPDQYPCPLVIFAHGFKGFKDWGAWNMMAHELSLHGIGMIKFNFSHNGTSPEHPTEFTDLEAFGQNTISTEVGDFQRIIEFLLSEKPEWAQWIDTQRLWLMGHSRGGGVALVTLLEHPKVRGAITLASINHFDRWDETTLKQWQKAGVIYIENTRTGQQMPLYYSLAEDIIQHSERFDLAARLPGECRPILILHGKMDSTVPYQEAMQLFEWAPNAELCIHPRADHAFNTRHPWQEKWLPEPMRWVIHNTVSFIEATAE